MSRAAGNPLGLYLHIPFCKSICPYCDFYSVVGKSDLIEAYVRALAKQISAWGARLSANGEQRSVDTVYFGGGTPSVLRGAQITRLLDAVSGSFKLVSPEITIEVNPGDQDSLRETLRAFSAMGGNRVSIGMQSGNDKHLKLLGRRHSFAEVEQTVQLVKSLGMENISLDIMLATEQQSIADVVDSVSKAYKLGAKHVSVYLLKVEEGTPFFERLSAMNLPNDDESAELYLAASNTLEVFGYHQYEISNFAFEGFESRHNLKYWLGEDYLGIGPAAHSFMDGKRFYFEDDLNGFIGAVNQHAFCEPKLDDSDSENYIKSGSVEEFIMLRLRLGSGVTESEFKVRFGKPIPPEIREKCEKLPRELICVDENGFRLTKQGFLVSNNIISYVIE